MYTGRRWIMIEVHIMFFLIFSVFAFSPSATADELSDLKVQFMQMQDRMQEQAKQMELMQKKIEMLETKQQQALPASASQPDESTPQPLQAISEKVEKLEGDVGFLQAQQDTQAKSLTEKIELHVYSVLEFEDFEKTKSSYDGLKMELLANAQLTDRLKTYFELEFERAAKTSIDSSGTSRQGEVELEAGWLEYAINDQFNPRFGVVTVPFGKFNALKHFEPFRDLTDRPAVLRRVIPSTLSEAGAGFTGKNLLPGGTLGILPDGFDMGYELFFINGLTNEFTDTGTRDARGAFGSDNNNNKAVVGRLEISPWENQEVGLSGYRGAYDNDGHNINGFDVDWEFKKGPFELIGEYALLDVEEGGFESDGVTAVPDYLNGYYLEGHYHFWFDFLNKTFLGRNLEDPTFTAVLGYGGAAIADDGDAGLGINKEDRWTLGLNYRPVETFVFKMEYQLNDSKNEALERGDNNGFIGSVSAAF